MDPNTSGSLVYKIDPLAPAANILQEGDIVLEVDGTPIADDGTVEFRNDERVEFAHLVPSHILPDANRSSLPFYHYKLNRGRCV
jgi:hypothetical protein